MVCYRNFQQKEGLEKIKMVREKRNGNEKRDVQKFISNSLLIGLYKAKK